MFQIAATKAFAPNFVFVNSSTYIDSSGRSDFCFDIKPDVCVYEKSKTRSGPTDVSCVDVIIEFKWNVCDDPFCDPYEAGEGDDVVLTFLRNTKSGVDTAGQITSYASAQLGSQFHTCVYSVLVVHSYARLIRWDRTGAIVSTPIYYNQDPELAEFFRRYSRALPRFRGIDTTVTLPNPKEVALARRWLEAVADADIIKFTVPVGNSQREYLTCTPIATPYTPPGRATRGFVAYDLERDMKVFVKDTWRVDLLGINREGETYELLREAGVRNIAPYSTAGDIDDHRTVTHLYKDKPWACPTARELVPHHHYRLVLDVIGDSLTQFSSTYEMLRCVLDALECTYFLDILIYSFLTLRAAGHEDAFNAGVLHRDISVGNILIVNGRGLLIDWDLSKRLNSPIPNDCIRQPTRTVST